MEDLNKPNRNLSVRIDLRLLCIVLLIIIAGLIVKDFAGWNLFKGKSDANSKITITGEATLKEEPDEYVFNPSWEKATQDEITALNESTVKGLKDLGVDDGDIKNNASAYDDYRVYPATEPGTPEAEKKLIRTLSLTITVSNKELAQKVQDYLLTTGPQGSITPYPQFSTAKQKELEDKARTQAIDDARARAETTAKGLDAKVGKVIEVSEGQSGGGCGGGICYGPAMATDAVSAERSSLSVQPGENEYTYSVQVIFELK